MLRATAAVLIAAVLATAPAGAQEDAPQQPPPEPLRSDRTFHRHFGFFFRVDPGLGYLRTSATSNGDTLSLSGVAGVFGIALGGAVSENVILAFHAYDAAAPGPAVDVSGSSTTAKNTTLAVAAFGPQLTFYFDSNNTYLSATVAVSTMSIQTDTATYNTKRGLGGRLAFGKEWWVSDHWGVGLAGQVTVSSNTDTGTNPATFFSGALSMVLSATFN